jgi:hypothetical protein
MAPRRELTRERVRANAIRVAEREQRRPFFTPRTLAAYLSISDRTARQIIADQRARQQASAAAVRVSLAGPMVIDDVTHEEAPQRMAAAAQCSLSIIPAVEARLRMRGRAATPGSGERRTQRER